MDIDKYIKLTNEEYEKNGKSELFIKAQNTIIATKNAKYIYEFAHQVENADINKLQDAIIKTRSAIDIYNFAKDIEGADIVKLENTIIPVADVENIYNFAKNVKGADIKKLEDAVIARYDSKYIYLFAKDIEGANISKLQDAIISTGNAQYIYSFAKDINDVDVKILQNAIIETKNAWYILNFAENVKGVDIEKLEDAVIATGNAKYICEFDKRINKCSTEKIVTVLAKIFDAPVLIDYLTYFKMYEDMIPGIVNAEISIQKYKILVEAFNTGSIKWIRHCLSITPIKPSLMREYCVKYKKPAAIYHYAKYMIVDSEEEQEKWQQALIDSGDVHYITEFANNIDWADKNRLQNAIKDIEDRKKKREPLEYLVESLDASLQK